MTSKLQQDFLLLFQCIIDFGTDVLRDCTKAKMKTFYQTDNFKIFLRKAKHHFFHQLPKQNPICCECHVAGCNIRKTGNMDRKIFDKFYFYDNTICSPPGHHSANGKKNPQTCICRFVEINNVLDELDLSDLNCLLRSSPMMKSHEEILLKELMEVRGKVCHAVNAETFSQHELANLWTTFMNSVCKLCPSDPKYLKKAIDLTKSSVLSDDKNLELIEKVQQVITDCHEMKPVIMEYTEKLNVFENRQNEHNTRVETRLARLESVFMGLFKAKQSNTQATISVYDSEKSNTTDVTYSGKQGERYIECEANCPGLDEDKALKHLATETDVNCSKKLKIESVEKHCILLKLSSRPELFENEEILHSAIMSLVQKIADAGDIDKSVDSNMDIKITFTSPLTDDERNIIVSMLGTYGTINEGSAAETTDRDEGIGDIDNNEMDYLDNDGHDEKKTVCPKGEFMNKLENPFYTIKTENMRNMPMDLPNNSLKKEHNEIKSFGFQSETVKMEATDRQDEEIFLRIGSMMCLWRIKGLPKRLQHLDDNQDLTIDEGNQVWYLQWRLECPKNWDILSVVEKLNNEKRFLRGYFNIDFVYSGMQREIVIETNTEKNVFNNYSSAELAFKTFIGTIVNLCELETPEPFDMSVTTSVLAVTDRTEDGSEITNPMEDSDIVCEQCKNVISCYKCTEKMEMIKELTVLLKTNDELIERLAQNMKMTKKEMIDGLEKKMATENDTTNEVLDLAAPSSTSDKELIEMEAGSEKYSANGMWGPDPSISMHMYPNMVSLEEFMSTYISSSQPGNQQYGSQQPVQPGIDHGNLPTIQNPPIQGQNEDRKIIWSGMVAYKEIPSAKLPRQLQMLHCQISIEASDPEIITTTWPKEMMMQFIPLSLLRSPKVPSFKRSRKVVFDFDNYDLESLRYLYRKMSSNFAGCVHFLPGTQSDVKVLLMMFSNKRQAFIGLIPNDQKAFIDSLKNLIATEKLKQAQAKQQSHIQQQAGGSQQQFGQLQVGLQKGQDMANSPLIEQPGATNTMVSTDMVTQTLDMDCSKVESNGNNMELPQPQMNSQFNN